MQQVEVVCGPSANPFEEEEDPHSWALPRSVTPSFPPAPLPTSIPPCPSLPPPLAHATTSHIAAIPRVNMVSIRVRCSTVHSSLRVCNAHGCCKFRPSCNSIAKHHITQKVKSPTRHKMHHQTTWCKNGMDGSNAFVLLRCRVCLDKCGVYKGWYVPHIHVPKPRSLLTGPGTSGKQSDRW